MHIGSLTHRSLALLLAALAGHEVSAALDGHCPPLGPVLPAPQRASANPAVKKGLADFKAALDKMTAPLNVSAVSVGVKTLGEEAPLFEYHFTPSKLDPKGVQKVTSDSMYRIASTSKVFPAYALMLIDGVLWEDPVTKYVPELRELAKQAAAQDAVHVVDWDEVTLGALASHTSGIPVDLGTDLTAFNPPWEKLGLPKPDPANSPQCSGLLDGKPCTWEDFFTKFGKRPPIYAPNTAPVYSNIGPALLGLVVERVSGLKFEDFVQQKILDALGMKHTSAFKPDDKLGVIPVDDQWWTSLLGFENASGSYYSSTHDLLALGSAILGSKLISPAKTRRWLKPWTSSSSLGTFIGTPWEIYRVQNVTRDGRLIELYTKGGDITTYHAALIMVPDYDLVVSVNVAGPEVGGFVQLIQATATTVLLPALEQASKDEAAVSFTGTYADRATNSSITLATDDAPGLRATNYTARGVDVLANYLRIGIVPTEPDPSVLVRLRLYPTNLRSGRQAGWRGVFDLFTPEEVAASDARYPWPQNGCIAWGTMDRLVYQYESLDYFVFNVEKGADGAPVATSIELPAYGLTLTRQ
ncbi:uncharacterized protein E0L32_007775 [Thyridium curvatum]|uniref:Uncharacterized protein n=1 Tax=Thyridium curvatum TaxID=1093900 RepID=A0A507AYN0_9PEZI|nr:uncharacterized protein E0L32_007775 [Thyridium curvatum]TPX11564.1 hypothetical protein E0L32_007775 [Thyridium curvatum]